MRQIFSPDRFETLLVEEIPALRRYARALCGDDTEADDLVQECLLRAVSRRHLWLAHRRLRPWLFTILHNVFVNTVRRNSRAPVIDRPARPDELGAADDDPDQLCTLADFLAALQSLSAEQREVLLLVGLEQMSYKEVARIAGVPVGTVMSRLSRARSQLARCLDGETRNSRIKRVK